MIHREKRTVHIVFTRKSPALLLLILLFSLFISLPSCKKESGFDSTAVTLDQLKGTWRGRMSTFKNNTLIEKNGDVSLFSNATGDLLDGIFELGQVNFLEGFMFNNGTLYFNLLLSDSTNPQCSNWNLAGHLFLQEENAMVIRIAGNECGPLGKQFVSYEGILILINPSMDPSAYFSFAAQGHTWTYETLLYNDITCQVQREITGVPSPYLYSVNETNDCGWSVASNQLAWTVNPFSFSVMAGSSSTDIAYTFYLDAVPDKRYTFINSTDTTYLTLTGTDVPVTVAAGNFSCGKWALESHTHASGDLTTKGTLYLNKQYGFIKMVYTEPADSTNIREMSLISVNF